MQSKVEKNTTSEDKVLAERLHGHFSSFMKMEASSGVMLIAMAVIAIIWANTSFETYNSFFNEPLSHFFGMNGFSLGHGSHTMISFDVTLKAFINDVLMVIFFFVVGAEIKREMVMGALSSRKTASLPVAAALGGMLVPAAIYLYFHGSTKYVSGWGVPMATDIAFAVGVLSLLGNRVHPNLKILLLAIAIADDLGAILVIAIGYTAHLNLISLALGGGVLIAMLFVRRIGVRRIWIFGVFGVLLWFCIYLSGVHATIAGVLLGLFTPTEAHHGEEKFLDQAAQILNDFEAAHKDDAGGHHKSELLEAIDWARQGAISPLFMLEAALAPWSAFLIIPLFALANAGVVIETSQLGGGDPVSMVAVAITIALVLGKPIGVLLFSYVAVKTKLSELTEGMDWPSLLGVGLLAGIGFTMAIFVGELAFRDPSIQHALPVAKIGIMAASFIAAILGLGYLYWHLRPKKGSE